MPVDIEIKSSLHDFTDSLTLLNVTTAVEAPQAGKENQSSTVTKSKLPATVTYPGLLVSRPLYD